MCGRLKFLLVSISCLIVFFCSQKQEKNFLGSAVVSSKTFQITSINQGNIIYLSKDEGDQVFCGELLSVLDTVALTLKIKEASAGIGELKANIAAKTSEIKAIQEDVEGARREFTRMDTLAKKGAVPTQQRDNLKTQFEASTMRLQANQDLLASYMEKLKGQQFRIDQLNDQLRKSYLYSPSTGIVLTRYHNLMEVVGPGNPIFEIGKFDTLYADFFVPQPLLASLKYGQSLRIRIDIVSDTGSNAVFIPAVLSWISPEAEFSPKNIQTRESRNELVFRIRATIPNPDGLLKRGLPVEVWR
ncbi:MAG TPA: HlyD family efflux transporter periplasmic adaptor subunit [Chitinispirillaceae bacterium]|nr:HlyD family efflux transporter periplasmic adaptor subunit [Chitinispirillaceae bacterium]